MTDAFIERQLENAMQGVLGNRAGRVAKVISRMAAKQGGGSAIENYQLLGKRALIAFGAVAVTVQVVASVVGFVVSRKREEQRIERVVRRVLDEDSQKDEAKAEAKAQA